MSAFSNDRLIYYLSAARGASAKTATEICVQATADPVLHEFGELLASPSIAALSGTAEHKYHDLLRLFAHGTVDDYRASPSSFPPFSDGHWKKLRVLTVVSLANGNNIIEYALLQQKLAVETVRQVEDVVLDAIYSGLLRARMDQRAAQVEIVSAVGRDVFAPQGVSDMISTLKAWVQRSTQLVEEIDDKINYIASHTALVKKQKAQAAASAEATRKQVWVDPGLNPPSMRGSAADLDTSRDSPMHGFDIHPNISGHRSSRMTETRYRR